MFNTYIRKTGDTTVIKQQPNDAADAARLYGEIRDKAKAETLGAVIDHLGVANEFKVAKVASEFDCARDKQLTRALFSINGVPYDLNVSVGRNLNERIEEATACAIMAEIMRQLRKKRF